MPVYVEMVKDKKTDKKIEKKVNDKKQYYIRTYITDENGKRKQITKHNKNWLGRDGQLEASQEENRLKKQINCNLMLKKITLNEVYENYVDYCSTRLKKSSLKDIKSNYRLYIKNFLGNKIVNELNNKDILNWHQWIFTKNFSIKFCRNIHVTLVSILNYACKYYELDKNVASIVGNFEIPKGTDKKNINFLTVNEFNEFIKNEKNEIYQCFFTILFFSGMRLGELWCLMWNDIDFENNKITINKSYSPKNEGITIPKTSKSNRKIYILDPVRNAVNIMKKYKNEDGFVFGLDKIKGTTLRRKCKNNCTKAKIVKNIRIHDFRHSFASMCIFNGIPVEIISEYLGHANISTTLNIYGHLYPNAQKILINTVNNFLKQDQKQDQKK